MRTYTNLCLIFLALFFASCEYTELDLLENPNAASPDQAEVEFLYNNIQLNFKDFFEATWEVAPLSRMGNKPTFTYEFGYPDSIGDRIWTLAYEGIFTSVAELNRLTDTEQKAGFARGSAKIMKAYALFTLVDIFGDIPLSEAGLGYELLAPRSEPGTIVYQKALSLLDEAIEDLKEPIGISVFDNYYDNDVAKWIVLANTLKLRAYANTRLIDPEAGIKIQDLLSNEDIIDEVSEGFTFTYGTTRSNPNSRHPLYNVAYERNDPPYLSNYYMWLMVGEKGILDPRIRFYFYRQISNSLTIDPSAYACVYNYGPPDENFYPEHYRRTDAQLPYCIASEDGYYGRDHMNGAEFPADGYARTTYGLYPAGGRFDDNSFSSTQHDGLSGALGRGIQPIWLSSFTHFVLAETHLFTNSAGEARLSLEKGIKESFEQVFNSKVFVEPDICDVLPCSFQNLELLVEAQNPYIEFVLKKWDQAPDQNARLDIIAKEYMIALWGNGPEAYNLYRRTAMPINIQPSLSVLSGNFPRSLLYPAVHINRNAEANQKEGFTPVFWDTNDASLFR